MRALLDTSVVIDLADPIVQGALPEESAVAAVTLAELAIGPLFTEDPVQRAIRQANLQRAESVFDVLPFDAAAARSYAIVVAAIHGAGRSHRSRVADLQIAAIAHANGLDLLTRNPGDFVGLAGLLAVHAV